MKRTNFSFRRNKKGDLNLSINAVVILILAITLLGVGLAFIKNTFGGLIGEFDKVKEQLSEEDRNSLLSKASSEKVSLLSTRMTVKGQDRDLAIGVGNVRPDTVTLTLGEKNSGEKGFIGCTQGVGGNNDNAKKILFESIDKITLKSGESEIVPVKIRFPSDIAETTYVCDIRLKTDSGESYADLSFQIEYKGG